VLEQELIFDATTAVSHADATGIVPTSATVTLYDPDGNAVEAPAVTKPTLSTTTTAGTTAASLILASVTGILRGDLLKITSDGIDYVVEVNNVFAATKVVTLIAALPAAPANGSMVKALRMTATLAAVGSAGIKANYRISWVYTDGTNARTVGIAASVVRWPWVTPCNASDVREILNDMKAGSRSDTFCSEVADKSDQKIRAKILLTMRRPELYVSAQLFADAGRAAIRYELAQRGICFAGQSIYDAQTALRYAFDDQMTSVITGLTAYDSNSDGKITGSEVRPIGSTVQAVR